MRTIAVALALCGGVWARSVPFVGGMEIAGRRVAVCRIPALAVVPDGALLAVCDARPWNGGDVKARQPIRIAARRSGDNGRTWSPSALVHDFPWNESEGEWSASDPSLIVDKETKTVFCFYNVWEWTKDKGRYRQFVQQSADGGICWSKPREITDALHRPEWSRESFVFVTSGHGIQLKDGTLLHTMTWVNAHKVCLFGSSDHGKTWGPVGSYASPGDECKVVERADGSWMVNARASGKKTGREVHVSQDRGKTWKSRFDASLLDPRCNAALERMALADGRDALVFANCNATKRRNLTLRASVDGGTTWSGGVTVEAGGAGYSDLAVLADGTLGVLYETAGCKAIAFEAVGRERLLPAGTDPVALPPEIARTAETWLCAGQSNMQWPLGRCDDADAEAAATAACDIRLWDFNTGLWHRITPLTAKEWSAIGVSFAVRRARQTGRPIALLYVAAGGAPTEAFISRQTMQGHPHLRRILDDGRPLDANAAFPNRWCAAEYQKRKGNLREARWWPVAAMHDGGLARVAHLPLTGILWYQGESNATPAPAFLGDGDVDGYLDETLRAVFHDLRGGRDVPLIVFGLPVRKSPWQTYRAAQRRMCAETGACYLDTFGAGLGDPDNVHPRKKVPFAEMAVEAAARLVTQKKALKE